MIDPGGVAAPVPCVQTVLGPLPTADLGATDAHDHLFLRSPALPDQELEDVGRAIAEVREAAASGLRAIIEMTPIGCGRRPDLLRAVSVATGIAVVGATGYHRDRHYPAGHRVMEAGLEQLVEWIVADLSVGMHPSDWDDAGQTPDVARAGVIKAGASYQRITRTERRRLDAAALGSLRTGAPILVHAEVGTCGHEIVDALEAAGVPTERVLIAHLDRNPDAELHAEIAARGVTLEYDTVGRIKYRPDSVLLDLIEAVIAAGHLDGIVLGSDLGRRDYFRSHEGGPGLRYLMATFVPRLERRIGPAAVQRILVDNAARAFALRPSPADPG